ncbi:uncharacterized protein LOC132639668 [Lycium barbarum]|uniref:uncharacterized protein LOC132639668 n=1 Tax=Lycium barbarum TaxID=112863 RepID=UPI00293EE3F0|nr:uncharacterized protein LOC132639668 [Lycium barbarum]
MVLNNDNSTRNNAIRAVDAQSTARIVPGTCKKEMYDFSLHELWYRRDAIALAWIMNTVSKDLVSTVLYASNAHKVWEDLRERFNKVNASRDFYLHEEIATLTQGVNFISVYFSKLKALRDESEALVPPPSCACPESKQHAENFHQQKLWQFLMGLNKSYAQARSQILMIEPTPTITQAYAMILNAESQRMHQNGASSSGPTSSSDLTALLSNKMQHKGFRPRN